MNLNVIKGLLALALSMLAGLVGAQAYPVQPIRMIVGFSAGSGTDAVARVLADAMKDELGQPVVIVNLPGAGSTLAAARAAAAAPDGYTLYFADSSHALAASIYSKLPYDSVKDFQGIGFVSTIPFAIVAGRSVPAGDLSQFIQLARSSPGKFSYGSSGVGATQHLFAETFARQIGTRFLHVPFKSGIEALNAVLAGDVDFTFFGVPPVLPHLQSGALKGFGVASATRTAFAPNLPTIAEAGLPGFEASTWNMVLAPKGIEPKVAERLNQVITKITGTDSFRQKIGTAGAIASAGASPDQVTAYLAQEVSRWREAIKAAGVGAQ